jgi:CRP-like cAMP-binding protein
MIGGMNCSVVARENMNELYASLAAEIRQQLERYEQIKAVSAGTRLISEGIPTEHLIIIRSGSAEVSLSSAGKEIPVGIARTGKVLGLRSVVFEDVTEISVTTLEECAITLIAKDKFIRVLKQNPQVYLAVVKVLSADLNMVNDLLRRIPRATTGRYRAANACKPI